MKNAILFISLLCLCSLQLKAQQINWHTEVYQLSNQNFETMEYIKDPVSPTLVTNFMTQTPNTTPQGSSYTEYYLKGFDTNGVEKWSFELPQHGKIIPDNNSGFWYYIGGGDSMYFNNQWYFSNYPSNQYFNKYFFKVNAQGGVTNWFVRGEGIPVGLYFNQFDIDADGNICITGQLSIDGISAYYPFSFANYSDTVHTIHTKLIFTAKIDTLGNELEFYPMKHTGIQSYDKSAVVGIQQNPVSKDYFVLIRAGDTLYLPTDTLINTTGTQLNMLLKLDSNFQYKSHVIHQMSNHPLLYQKLKWSNDYEHFYIASNYGDTFFLNQTTPLLGHPGTVQNAMVAKFNAQTLEVEATRTFRPNDHSRYFANMNITDFDVDASEKVHFVGSIYDSTFTTEDSVLTYYSSNGTMDPKGFYMCLNSNLDIVYDVVPEDNKGLAYYRNVNADPVNDNIYVSGKFGGSFVINPDLSINGTGNWYEGLILCFNDTSKQINDEPSSILVLDNKVKCTAYPNPANNGHFYFTLSGDGSITTIEMFDFLGRKVYPKRNIIESTSNRTMWSISLSDYSAGTYFIKATTSTATYTKKVVLH